MCWPPGSAAATAPVAPGTVGAAAAVVIAYLLGWRIVSNGDRRHRRCGVIGIWAATVEARSQRPQGSRPYRHRRSRRAVDHARWRHGIQLEELALGFLLFRLFDIWKPPPVRQLEKLPGGTGIMADDLMAGVYGAVVLYLAGYFHLY